MDATEMLSYGATAEQIVAATGISTGMLLVIVIAITIVTGLALYKAAQLREKVWFWVMLIIGTAGILPAIYLYLRRKK